MATQIPQTTQETSQGRMLSEDEARMIQENPARENLGKTLNQGNRILVSNHFGASILRPIRLFCAWQPPPPSR